MIRLPGEISKLNTLREFNLSSNRLLSLPGEIGKLSPLAELNLSSNQLTTLPEQIGKLNALRKLDLSSNRLATLPGEIGKLNALKELSLSSNQLTRLPGEIGGLTALVYLDLSFNQLTTLPEEIESLVSLERLNVEENLLIVIPAGLRQLQLVELTLHGNDELWLPRELLGPTYTESKAKNPPADPKAILDFYFSRLSEGDEPMREVRLLLVGRGRVGKTSLLKRLRGESFDLFELETPGINVKPLELPCSRGTATVHVWDFGGQEFLHGTHQIFLSKRCVYLLVLQGRESNWETETDYWLRFIESFGGDSPVIIVLTKYDDHPFSVDRYRLQERCPQIAGFIETDSFTRRGIEAIQQLLATSIAAMQDVWLGVPKTWHRVKRALTDMPQSFLEYDAYQELCKEFGVIDEGHQDSLAQTLHRLGVALNFRDHHRLRQTSVLKPKWVTEAIYGLIRYVQKKDCHGVLRFEWLADALPANDYPADKYGFVLELMERFEVAFQMEGTQNWLIPELLREEQPEPFDEFRGLKARRLRFVYPDAMPPGLLPRFIVRTHEMSEAHPDWRWRSGVVLEWGESRALVRLNRSERRTEVAVIESASHDQQDLFDLIRAHLTVLHGKIRVVEEVEMEGYPDSWVPARKLRSLEQQGTRETTEETRDGKLTTVKVKETLDGVESSAAREADRPNAPQRMRLFISYAHADHKKIKALSTHLTILGERGYIQPWDDKNLIAGEDWNDRIMTELNQADVILLMHSHASYASKFIQKVEAPAALERAKTDVNPCTLIVVPVDRTGWDSSVPRELELSRYQAATRDAVPICDFKPQRRGWQQVEQAIRDAVELRRKRMPGADLK